MLSAVILTGAVVILGMTSIASISYLLVLLAAASFAHKSNVRSSAVTTADETTFAVVVPAHDEELVIGAMLSSLDRLDYPRSKFEIVVIADNCSDATAEIARAAGATVIERFNTVERGKGYALAEGTRFLLSQGDRPDAVVIVDADTFVAEDFLRVMAQAVSNLPDSENRAAFQGRYGVLNIEEGWRPALMAGAFDLFNHVKPLGREALGLSAGLKGNGMVFTRALLEAAPFTGKSITEDIDYGLDLLLHHGVRTRYVADAVVRAQMPVTGAQAKSQRERWEHGRFKLLRERAPSLLEASLKRRDIRLADAAVDLLLPPLAEIAMLLSLWAILTVWLLASHAQIGAPAIYVGALVAAIAGFVIYILGGFRVADAPREAYHALLKAPGYAVWKLATLAVKPLSKLRRPTSAAAGTEEWVRTERIRMSARDGHQAP